MSEAGRNKPSKRPVEFLTLDYIKEDLQDKALTLTVEHYKEAMASESRAAGPNNSTNQNEQKVNRKGSGSKKRSNRK